MDFRDGLLQLSQRLEKLKENMPTEEATKNALVMPLLSLLGYDVFNPDEVLPEFICDIGTKKGEKIDYAIMFSGTPVILIECKHWQQNLTLHDNQLLRYFNVSPARFGVLTNGIKYLFYSDLQEPNKMDTVPFLEIDLESLSDGKIEELKKFHKSYFNIDTVLSTASELKYLGEFRALISKEFNEPSSDFVRLLTKKIYTGGQVTQKVIEDFTPLLKRAISSYFNDLISARLKVAMENEETASGTAQSTESEETATDAYETTEEEMEGYYIVRAVLSREVDPKRITYKDTQNYFAIILDGKVTRTICRLRFNYQAIRRVSFINDDKTEDNIDLKDNSISDIYNYQDRLIQTLKHYL